MADNKHPLESSADAAGEWDIDARMAEAAPTIIYVNAYAVRRNYGGPEEGGWWYDSGEPLASIPLGAHASPGYIDNVKDNLRTLIGWPVGPTRQGRYSVIGDADFEIMVEEHVARAYPDRTPHYE